MTNWSLYERTILLLTPNPAEPTPEAPPLNQGVPDHPYSNVIKVKTLHHTYFEKHFFKLTPFLKSYVTNISRIDCGKRLGGHNNLSQNHIMHKITG
jgi:hypothetical protein